MKPEEELKKMRNADRTRGRGRGSGRSNGRSVTAGFYVGEGFPKSLADRAEDIYGGNTVDLIDSIGEIGEDLHYSPGANVFATIYYDQNQDGSVNITDMAVTNDSDWRVFVDKVALKSQQTVYPNPLRIRPQMNSEHFLSIDSHTTQSLWLTPSGDPNNPSNHFTPAQTLKVEIIFRFVPAPSLHIVTFDLLP